MKKELVLFFLIISAGLVHGQNFEGEIVYENTFKSNIPGLTNEKLQSMMGNRQEYFVKEGKYKSLLNGQVIAMQLYDDKTNRLYNKLPKSDTLYWFDAVVNGDSVISYELKKSSEMILGKPCNILVLQTSAGTTTFYYNPAYKVNSDKYTSHKYGNWAFFTSKAGSLPLKMVIETPQFTMESTAVEIKPLKLQDDFFSVDVKTPTKRSG